ncbi:MAG: aminotransferase class I/II-fold pyridoxal phosphate-dependent enzyme [Gammaproteobacteria bacterium]|nr:aminotransferase class I/II-fold pyridoxal phosphate-dependent enzyme [Gammaproteobacteria bacterium]
MSINLFKLEEYLTQYEFSSPHLFCCSDAESVAMSEVIGLANQEEQNLWHNLQLKYTEPFGYPALRSTIAKVMYEEMTADNILCFAGAEEGIYCALYALCEPEDHVIVLTPCYQSLKEIPKMKGCEVTTLDLKESNDWKICLDDIKQVIQSNTKCLVMNFPHNPSGQIISQQALKDLVQLLDYHGIWLFSDEVYHHLGAPTESWASPAADVYPKALSLGVMSKAFGMPGLRVGWIACQNKAMLQNIKQMKDYASICNSAPSEILSLIALRNKHHFLNKNNRIVKHNLALLEIFFSKFSDKFRWVKPQGGCIGFVNYLSDETSDSFCKRLVEKHGILLMPASVYDHTSNHFRIGFGRRNMPEVLTLFESVIVA